MRVDFVKMHGLGNDVVVLDTRAMRGCLSREQIRRFADRHEGVGFDQLMCLHAPSRADVDFDLRVYNADGGQVEQCGNGTRCVGKYVKRLGLCEHNRLKLASAGRVLDVIVNDDDSISCDMGVPVFEATAIPILAESGVDGCYRLDAADRSYEVRAVSMGNPHIVLAVEDIATADVERVGPLLEKHAALPQRANVGFCQVVDRQNIRLRVFERGVGETKACGTGACAAMAVGRACDQLASVVKVDLLGGSLEVTWQGGSSSLWMRGPAEWVFEGTIEL